VPGGRFLLTSNCKGELHLWDIGYNAGGHMKSSSIATLAGSEATWPYSHIDQSINIRPVRNHPKREPLMHLKVRRRCRGGCGQR